MSTESGSEPRCAFVDEVLRIYASADLAARDSLWWKVKDDDTLGFYATCSDFFWFATADLEAITEADLPLLRQTLADLRELDEDTYLSELYAARKRHMRPMDLVYTDEHKLPEAVAKLFNAAGPSREGTKQSLGGMLP